MQIEDYSEQEIEYVLKSFSSYIKLVVSHAAIDYARMIKAKKGKLIPLSECIEKEMSLSRTDSGIFHFVEDSEPFSKDEYNEAFFKLSEKEQKVLLYYRDGLAVSEISKRMKLSESNIKVTKYNSVNKFKSFLREIEKNEDK